MLPTQRLPLESSFRLPRLSSETAAVRPRAPLWPAKREVEADARQSSSAPKAVEARSPSWDRQSVSLVADPLGRVGVETRLSAHDISAQVERERIKALSKRDPSPGRRSLPKAVRAEEGLRRTSAKSFCKERLRQKLAEMLLESRK